MAVIDGITPEEEKLLSLCPYSCFRGKIYLDSTKSMENCPHCAEIYDKISKGNMKNEEGKDIYKILCIPNRYKNIEIVLEEIFPNSVVEVTSSQSRQEIIEELKDISNIVIRGDKLYADYLFYLGVETDILPYVFNLLRKGYAQGFTVVPYINTLELIQLYKVAEEPIESGYKVGEELQKELGVTYMNYCKADLCIISLTPSSGQSSINMLYSLLKSRKARDLRTIVFSETLGASRELGYSLNREDFIQRFINKVEKNTQKTKENARDDIRTPIQLEISTDILKSNLGVAPSESNKNNDYKGVKHKM